MPELGEMTITSGGRAFYSHVPGVPDADSLRSNMREMVPPEIHFDDAAVINLSQAMVKRGLFRGPNPVIAIGTCAYSCVLLRMPNSLRSTPRSSLGLLSTITCIPIPTFPSDTTL